MAEDYAKNKFMPCRRVFEIENILRECGIQGNEDICDLACGEGFYTRKFRALTKGKVCGLDISEGMIELAKKQPCEGIDYIVHDCSKPINLN